MELKGKNIEELALLVSAQLKSRGVEVVAVGGFVAAHYSSYRYLTKDVDFVDITYQTKKLQAAMAEAGFTRRGKNYFHPDTEFTLEFPPGPLSVGDELVIKTATLERDGVVMRMLSASDIVKDRLAAFIHWRDNQALAQAVAIMIKQNLGLEDFLGFAEKEGGPVQKNALIKHYQDETSRSHEK